MYKRHHIVIILLAIGSLVGFAACKKWVDVDAPLQVHEDNVFASEEGFRHVLNGVYLKMGDSSLYGRELSFGLLSIVGRSYDTSITPAIKNMYYQGARYNFQDVDVKAGSARTWESMYQCIANLNYLLTNVESRKNVFATENNYNAIKGEALGLRAFLYFDLVRLFAPAPAVDPSGAAVPYVTKVSPYGASVSTTSAVIDSCIAELITAQSLLSTSDVTTTRFTTWGVQGLLARIYLYKGDLVNARGYAMGLINSKQFPLSGNNTDPTFQKEHLFSLYNNTATIGAFYKSVLSTTPPLGFTLANQTTLFVTGSGSTNDWRKTFNDPTSGLTTGTLISPRKCWGNTASILPMIRMTEMYYIAAESASALLDSVSATNLMDTVRVHRNLAKYTLEPLKRDSLAVEIGKEYQKEFLSEGQVFYYYKRRNLPFSALPFTRVQPVAGASWVFIKPE